MKTKYSAIPFVLTFAFLAFLPSIQAVSPAPDGCYPGYTTAEGCSALQSLTTGLGNTGIGWYSLLLNTTGSFNTAVGAGALDLNTADSNTAVGAAAMLLNTTGTLNTATGTDALVYNDSGSNNTANGAFALFNSTGDYNTALGANAGTDPDILSNNIYIGDPGFPGDENVISIGGIAASGTDYTATYIGGIYGASVSIDTAALVYVDTDGHLGTVQVDANGKPGTAPARRSKGAHPQAMINRKVAELQTTVAQQQKQIETLTAQLKEQAAQIQKVSAHLEMSQPATTVVANKP